MTAIQLSRADGARTADGTDSSGIGAPSHNGRRDPTHVRTAITIDKPLDKVRAEFERFPWTTLDAHHAVETGQVRLVPAPGDRGTEVHTDLDSSTLGGFLGTRALKAIGRAPDQRTSDELRQFKALVETGVIPRSEKTPEGPSMPRQIFQRPARPLDERS